MGKRETVEKDGILYIKCNKCWKFKEATNEFFDKNHVWYLWLQWCCKVCRRKYQKEYANINRDKIRENSRNFYKNHKDRCETSAKQWRENNKEYFLDKCREYRKNNKLFYNAYMKEYRNNNKDGLRAKRIERDNNKWYVSIHNKTNKLIRKLWIKPTICPICWEKHRIYSHHPNYGKWNEIVFCCQSCHQLIHSGRIECPKIIDILTFNK